MRIGLFVNYFDIKILFFYPNSLFQASGDIEDLELALKKKNPHHIVGSGSCSALIKLLPNNKELFISHVTWTTYIDLLRIFKMYDFPFKTNQGKG
jgi:hypothetical protein